MPKPKPTDQSTAVLDSKLLFPERFRGDVCCVGRAFPIRPVARAPRFLGMWQSPPPVSNHCLQQRSTVRVAQQSQPEPTVAALTVCAIPLARFCPCFVEQRGGAVRPERSRFRVRVVPDVNCAAFSLRLPKEDAKVLRLQLLHPHAGHEYRCAVMFSRETGTVTHFWVGETDSTQIEKASLFFSYASTRTFPPSPR